MPEKNFRRRFFTGEGLKKVFEDLFFGDRLKKKFEDLSFLFWRTLALVSLFLGLGLEHSCRWPQEGLSSEGLSLALTSDFFFVFLALASASSLVSSTPPLLLSVYTYMLPYSKSLHFFKLNFVLNSKLLCSHTSAYKVVLLHI